MRGGVGVIAIAAMMVSCGGGAKVASDPTREGWYVDSVKKLAAIDREAEADFEAGKRDDAATLIEKGQPIEKRIIEVPHPSFEATKAASDLDDLYGRMLLTNRHYGWARLLFQKNFNRWKHWQPQNDETRRLYQQAVSEIAECDKHIDE